MNRNIRLLSIATGILTGVTAIGGYILSNKIMYIANKDPKFIHTREVQAKRLDENWYNICKKIDINIPSPHGYHISGTLLQPLETTKTVIISHGVTENKVNSIRYAQMFARLGYNSFIFDHRRHGNSGGKTTSYGHYEKGDLQAVVQTIRNIIGNTAKLGIHGESMGAATMILYAGTIEDGADFYISDCSYSNFSELLSRIFQKTFKTKSKIPLHLTNLFLRLRDGYGLRNITPREAVDNVQTPMLFIHSVLDDFTPSKMTVELYLAKKERKELKLFDKGLHAQSFNENPKEYEETIREFISKYVE